ncbi:hypothetical protein [Paludibaculum fermentans]|uniref:hypothetical protein n=1 Tax=Paludibaculum fermentans TaxID=1473598 RepID=UPI003EBBBB06
MTKPHFTDRSANRALVLLSVLGGLFLWTFADAAFLRSRRSPVLASEAAWTGRLKLTDLCLLPEARYTRHLSQADLHSAFQDHPAALEHFPSGSLVPPPPSVTKTHANLD